jgi:hypothetical protein
MAVTFDPAAKGPDISLSGGNLAALIGSIANYETVKSTLYKSTGKWYAEFTMTAVGNGNNVGICNSSQSVTAGYSLGIDTNGYGYYVSPGNGRFLYNGTNQ